MALTLGQVAVHVSGSGAVPAGLLPPGGTMTLAVPSGGQDVYAGTASTVTSGNGYPLVAGSLPVTVSLPQSAQPVTVWLINSSASTATTCGVVVSTSA